MRLSGRVPQICCLFGPSAAGGAYIPSFCDIVIMVEGNASMYLGSPRMAEMVIGEMTTLEEMGGARMHATVSGCGDNLAVDDADAIDQAKAWFTYFPTTWREEPPRVRGRRRRSRALDRRRSCPTTRRQGYDMHDVIDGLVDAESFFEIKPLFAPELIVGLGRLDGQPGRHRRQQPDGQGRRAVRRLGRQGGPVHLVLRRVQHPAGVPGRRARLHGRHRRSSAQGIIRHGAKMITAVSEATVPKVSVIVRKAYGAGLYAMAGPGVRARGHASPCPRPRSR